MNEDPRLLELAARNVELNRQLTQAHDSEAALDQKVKSLSVHETCGCSYDHKDDVCMHHSPKLAKALQEIALLKEQIRVADVAYNYLHGEHLKLKRLVMEEADRLESYDGTDDVIYTDEHAKKLRDAVGTVETI